jgi:hypothetical protein
MGNCEWLILSNMGPLLWTETRGRDRICFCLSFHYHRRGEQASTSRANLSEAQLVLSSRHPSEEPRRMKCRHSDSLRYGGDV